MNQITLTKLSKMNWKQIAGTVLILTVTVTISAAIIVKTAKEHVVIAKSDPPQITQVTLTPEIIMPKIVGVYDIEVDINSADYVETDTWEKNKQFDREVGKIKTIKLNVGNSTYLVTTDLGWVVSIPLSVPIRMGESLKLRQDYDDDDNKYRTWVCPQTGKLCTGISSK